MTGSVAVSPGFADRERAQVAALYWQAFGAKLDRLMRPEAQALAFFKRALDPGFALVARDADGTILGLAGFKATEGGLTGAGFSDLARVYGRIGATWRAALLALLERPLQPGVLQMDGILVEAAACGRGIGTLLLQAVLEEARRRGLREVQLDVIDTNPRAKALYERMGFVATAEVRTRPLRWLFGFSSATRMRHDLG